MFRNELQGIPPPETTQTVVPTMKQREERERVSKTNIAGSTKNIH